MWITKLLKRSYTTTYYFFNSLSNNLFDKWIFIVDYMDIYIFYILFIKKITFILKMFLYTGVVRKGYFKCVDKCFLILMFYSV